MESRLITIDLNDEEHWAKQIETVDALQEEITLLIPRVQKLGQGAILKELTLAQELLVALRLAWDMTETAPGEVAAMTVEPVDDDERVELRYRLTLAITTATETIEVAKTALK